MLWLNHVEESQVILTIETRDNGIVVLARHTRRIFTVPSLSYQSGSLMANPYTWTGGLLEYVQIVPLN